jgi:short-subunit dehydrogenase
MNDRAQRRFVGKVTLVTGASSGIGAAVARALAAEGATVVLVARTQGALDAVAGEIRAAGGRAFVVPADLGDTATAIGLVERVVAAVGRIDVLVNNAAANHRGPVEERSFEELGHIVSVNLVAPMLLARAALPHLRRSEGGSIVNVASLAGRVPFPDEAAYCATKAALRAFSFALAEEMAGTGVRISVVSPGPVDTGFIRDDLANVPDIVFSQPMSTPEDVAALVLASALDGVRERTSSVSSRWMTTFGYLFPRLRSGLMPLLEHRGRAAKIRYERRALGSGAAR